MLKVIDSAYRVPLYRRIRPSLSSPSFSPCHSTVSPAVPASHTAKPHRSRNGIRNQSLATSSSPSTPTPVTAPASKRTARQAAATGHAPAAAPRPAHTLPFLIAYPKYPPARPPPRLPPHPT